MQPSEEICEIAREVAKQVVLDPFFPQEQWYELSADWEVRFFIDTAGYRRAVIYPLVEEGRVNIPAGGTELDIFHQFTFVAPKMWKCTDCGLLDCNSLPDEFALCPKTLKK